ncbi:hypothetical protein ACQKPX_23980 [Photobacterium sp. DNB23_23_1]
MTKKVIVISSPGGHSIQAKLIYDSLSSKINKDIIISNGFYKSGEGRRYNFIDCNINTPIRVLILLFNVFLYFFNEKPSVVISTGAAPGAIFIFVAKLFRVKTIWVDSVANVDKVSLSGRIVKHFTDVFFVQWEGLKDDKLIFKGRVF